MCLFSVPPVSEQQRWMDQSSLMPNWYPDHQQCHHGFQWYFVPEKNMRRMPIMDNGCLCARSSFLVIHKKCARKRLVCAICIQLRSAITPTTSPRYVYVKSTQISVVWFFGVLPIFLVSSAEDGRARKKNLHTRHVLLGSHAEFMVVMPRGLNLPFSFVRFGYLCRMEPTVL